MHVQFSPKNACIITTHIILQRRTHMQEQTYIRWTRIKVRSIYFFTAGSVARTHIEIHNNFDTKQLKFFHFPPTQLPHVPSSTRNLTLAYASTTQRYEMSIFYSTGDVDLPSLGLRTHYFFFSFFKTHWIGPLVPRQYQ